MRVWLRNQFTWNFQQVMIYLLGCVIFSIGAKFFIDSNLGTDPLDVLCIGMTKHLPVTIGIASGIVAICFLFVWGVWNQKIPPVTPFFTTFSVGCLIDLWNFLPVKETTSQIFGPYSMLVVGLLCCSFASALIIMSGIGIRIMDLVAITMIDRWKWSFFKAKMSLEVMMFTLGWILGGPVGIGTVGFLALVGPMIQPFMWANNKFFKIPNYGLPKAPRVEPMDFQAETA